MRRVADGDGLLGNLRKGIGSYLISIGESGIATTILNDSVIVFESWSGGWGYVESLQRGTIAKVSPCVSAIRGGFPPDCSGLSAD